MKLIRIATIGVAVAAAAAIIVAATRRDESVAGNSGGSAPVRTLPTTPGTYLGVYTAQVPNSYTGVAAFTTATGVRPGVTLYYSGWREPFRLSFALAAAKGGAVPLVQMEPTKVSLAAIASGHYDSYLTTYAEAVQAYGKPVILSFGHEMNGDWYSWGYRHTSPATFIAAWRHIVSIFRAAHTYNVTWLWTVNIIHDTLHGKIPRPGPWWPGGQYVNWVGIDGYYLQPSWRFAPLFGPTIAAVRELTSDPILIAETAVAPGPAQADKITDLFSGIRSYGLLGLVWFDANGSRDWRLSNPTAIAAFRKAAVTYRSPMS